MEQKMPDNKQPFHSGFVTLVGRPNVGKSTLMNALIGEKIAIISSRPQTTRNKITGIMTTPEAQVIFIDTPGIHRHKGKLNELMVKTARDACGEVDIILMMVEATRKPSDEDEEIIRFVGTQKTKIFLVINKVDQVKKEELLPLIELYSRMADFDEVIPLSALKGNNLSALMDAIVAHLPEGPMYYPEDEITGAPERFIAAEIIREKILKTTRDEIPYSSAVVVEEMKERKTGKVFIRAVIYVEKESQKGIIIGDGGKMLKTIGQFAREDIEKLFGISVYLDLWVKASKDWREKSDALKEMGYE